MQGIIHLFSHERFGMIAVVIDYCEYETVLTLMDIIGISGYCYVVIIDGEIREQHDQCYHDQSEYRVSVHDRTIKFI